MDPTEPDPTVSEPTGADPTASVAPSPAAEDDDPSLVARARGTGVGLEDETIVGDDEPRIVSDPDPDADPGAVT